MQLKKESTTRLHLKNTLLYSLYCLKYAKVTRSMRCTSPSLTFFFSKIKGIIVNLTEFLDQRLPSFIPENIEPPGKGETGNRKLRTNLSVDQLALALSEPAYDQEIIITKSLNNFFTTLAHYFSSSERDQLSYFSMRSKSYSAENLR